jgi:hypothetical protein
MTSVGRSIETLRSAFPIALALVALALGPAGDLTAQELEPRSYRTLPTGLNFLVLGYSLSSGNVLLDPTSPVEDLELDLHVTQLGYLRSFGLFGRSASVSVVLPYGYFTGSATVDGEPVTGERDGAADLRARLSVNLLGGPALTPQEFARYRQRRNVGISLALRAPTGQYDTTKLLNFGSNRWSFKPEIGYSSIRGRWILDAAVGVWLFTANHDFLGGSTLRQEPIGSVQGHLSYNFDSGVWLALDANYFTGGRTEIDGAELDNLQANSRVGVTLSVPVAPRHSLKLIAQTGAYTRFGAEFSVGSVVWQYRW